MNTGDEALHKDNLPIRP